MQKLDIIKEAYEGLKAEREFGYLSKIKHSRKFKAYNANVKLYGDKLTFNLSREWKGVDRDILIGLIQELMIKILSKRDKIKKEMHTKNMDMYHIFIKKVHLTAPKTKIDRQLFDSFNRNNENYFFGTMEAPNLVFGINSLTLLGTYEYGTDTITISNALKDAPEEILDYVMYHEMLHKKFKFSHLNGRSHHHTPEFKQKEKEYEHKEIEEQISRFLRNKRYRPSTVQKQFHKGGTSFFGQLKKLF